MNKKVMELMKDDWGGNVMIKIAALDQNIFLLKVWW